MKAQLPKRPENKGSGIRRDGDLVTVDVHLRRPDGGRWRRRGTATNMSDARKLRDSYFAAFNLEILHVLPASGVGIDRGGPTIAELAERCMTELWPRTAPRSLTHYSSKVKGQIVPALGHLKVKAITGREVRDFVYSLADRKGKEALSIATCRHTKATLSAMMAFAVEEQIIDQNPCLVKIAWSKLRDGRGEVREAKRILTEPELERLIAAAKGTPIEFAVLFQARLGLRIGEAIALVDTDFVGGVCRVRRQIHRRKGTALRPEPLKTASSVRDIPVPESVQRAIQGHTGAFTVNEVGGWLEPRKALEHFVRVCMKAGLDGIGTHDLRHSFVSLLLNKYGVPATVVQRLVGHSAITTTLSFYSHASSDQLRAAMARIP